jgi:ribonuclease BN (tRNA processing enzyme)
MQLQFVGCGDALGSGGRSNTGFHVTGERVNFLIDCGASSLPALKRLAIARDNIDLILITHFHGDHFGGLPFLLLDAQFMRRTRPLVIAGPDGSIHPRPGSASICRLSRSGLRKRGRSAR